MYRTIFSIAALGAALIVAVPAHGKGQPAEPQWMQALEVRSQELNREHGLGQYDPALRALRLRSEALNRQYGLGQAYPASTIAVNDAIESVRDRRSPEWLAVFMRGQDAINRQDGLQAAYPYSTTAVSGAIDAVRRGDGTTVASPDVFERAVAARIGGESMLDRFVANDDRVQPRPTSPTVVVASTSGTDVEWPQVGIGFGIGIALVLGLMLALRATRQRPLAH